MKGRQWLWVAVLAGCTGARGPAGASVTVAAEAPGANCAAGGTKLSDGTNTSYVCNGASGASAALAGDVVGTPGATVIRAGLGFGAHNGTPNVRYVNSDAATSPAPDGSLARPFPTLAAAAAAANTGDEFVLTGGFDESVTFTHGVTLRGANAYGTNINGGLTFTFTGTEYAHVLGVNVYCNLSAPCISVNPGTNLATVVLRDVQVSQTGAGTAIAGNDFTSLTLERCRVYSSGSGGLITLGDATLRDTTVQGYAATTSVVAVAGTFQLAQGSIYAQRGSGASSNVALHLDGDGTLVNATIIGGLPIESMRDARLSGAYLQPEGTSPALYLGSGSTAEVYDSRFQMSGSTGPEVFAAGSANVLTTRTNWTSNLAGPTCTGCSFYQLPLF